VVSFALRSPLYVVFNCLSDEFEVGNIKVSCKDSKVVFKIIDVVGDSPEVINGLGRRAAELFTRAMSLVQGVGFDTDNLVITWSSTTPQITSEGKVIVAAGATVTIKYLQLHEVQLNKELIERTINLMNKLEDALRNPSTSKRAEEVLRVIRWWALGDLDTDPVDRFLKFFIAFEMLASLKGYKGKFSGSWVEEFCSDYGLTCEFEGMSVNRVRNLIMHEPGEDRERAEEVTRKHADEFGQEVLKAIRKVVSK
jgi:hypothetical protein